MPAGATRFMTSRVSPGVESATRSSPLVHRCTHPSPYARTDGLQDAHDPAVPRDDASGWIELGTRRLEEDGFVEVRFDPTSLVGDAARADDGDWELGFLVVDPTPNAETG